MKVPVMSFAMTIGLTFALQVPAIPMTVVAPSRCFHGATSADSIAGAEDPDIIYTCGSPSEGVVRTGHEHPVDQNGADDQNLPLCFYNVIIGPHDTVPSGPGTVALRWTRPNGNSATVVYRNGDGHVVTMYTNDGPAGNNWSGCNTDRPPSTVHGTHAESVMSTIGLSS